VKNKENLILSQIIKNVYFREKIVPNIKAIYFEDDDNSELFVALKDLTQDNLKKIDSSALLLRYPKKEKIRELLGIDFENENIDWLIDETEKWARLQAIKNAVMQSVDIIVAADKKKDKTEGDFTQVEKLVKDAVAVSFDKNLGINYFDDIEGRIERYKKQDEGSLSTGYRMLDYYTCGGLKPKTLTVLLAQVNLGKTQALCNLSANFMKSGLKGIYLTLELEEDIIARRHDSILTKIPYSELPISVKEVTSFFDKWQGTNEYFIREYPPSKASCINIRTYFKELEMYMGFKFDYLIVDYINIMKSNYYERGQNSYEVFKNVTIELREIATEYNIPVITAAQVGRESFGSSSVGMDSVRSSMGIVENSDLIISMSQTPDQEPDNFITWTLVKNRLGRRMGSIETVFNTSTLTIEEILADEDRQLLERVNSCRNNKFSEKIIENNPVGFEDFT